MGVMCDAKRHFMLRLSIYALYCNLNEELILVVYVAVIPFYLNDKGI